ncbi:MAG: methyltransferase [Nanoarchaeota archaeon]
MDPDYLLLEQNPYYADILDILTKTQQAQHHLTYVKGLPFAVLPAVFSPQCFPSNNMFAECLEYVENGNFLEVGCGAGFASVIAAAQHNMHVTSIDISKQALHNTRVNAVLHRVEEKVEVFESDVYENITPTRRFDVIYCNLPFLYADQMPRATGCDTLQSAVVHVGYDGIRRCILQAPRYLTEDGSLFLGFSRDMGDVGRLDAIIEQSDLSAEVWRSAHGSRTRLPFTLDLIKLQKRLKTQDTFSIADALWKPNKTNRKDCH